jgi:hypothetical protein
LQYAPTFNRIVASDDSVRTEKNKRRQRRGAIVFHTRSRTFRVRQRYETSATREIDPPLGQGGSTGFVVEVF